MAIVFVLEPKKILLLQRHISLLCILFSIGHFLCNGDIWYPYWESKTENFCDTAWKRNKTQLNLDKVVLFFLWRTVVFRDEHLSLLSARWYALLLYNDSISWDCGMVGFVFFLAF